MRGALAYSLVAVVKTSAQGFYDTLIDELHASFDSGEKLRYGR
jgi:hypothetical protein